MKLTAIPIGGPLQLHAGELLWDIDRVHMRNRLPIFASTKVAKDWDEGSFGFCEVDEVIP